jgi:hypothetical protein
MDLRIATAQSTSVLRKLGYADAAATSIVVQGVDFIDVVSVEINGTRSTAFVVLSPTRLTAAIPAQHLGKAIQSVVVYRGVETVAGTESAVRFDLASPGMASDGALLVQRFLKILLTSQGSDAFRPDLGTQLRSLVGSTLPAATLRARATFAVDRASQLLRKEQTLRPVSNPAEMLKSATLLSAVFSPETSTLDLRVRINSMDGSSMETGMIL